MPSPFSEVGVNMQVFPDTYFNKFMHESKWILVPNLLIVPQDFHNPAIPPNPAQCILSPTRLLELMASSL